MSKSILTSKQPQIICNVLNGNASVLIFKKFPKDYRGWVYIYCTKGKPYKRGISKTVFYPHPRMDGKSMSRFCRDFPLLNGKVVARFYCNNVEEISHYGGYMKIFWTKTFKYDKFLKKSCLTYEQLHKYYLTMKSFGFLKAVHISQLEIFDIPKPLWHFEKYGSFARKDIKCKNKDRGLCNRGWGIKGYSGCEKARLTKAPRSYCYVEEN